MAKNISVSKLKHYWHLYLFILPSIVLVATFSYYPCVSAIYHAFFRWNGDYINEFVGLGNFRKAFDDPVLWGGFLLIGILIVANLFKMIPAMVTAVVISRIKNAKSTYIYRVLFVVPMIIPAMVNLLIWKFFYDPTVGLLNKILNATGIMYVLGKIDTLFHWGIFEVGRNPVWLGDTELVIPALIFWGFPWIGVVGVLIYLSGLQSIDDSVHEAAALDGVGPIQKFFYIELPLILTQVRINLVFLIIGTMQGYGLILVLFGDGGGPNGVAMVPGLYMFSQAFRAGYCGYACAIGLILFVFILILAEINNRYLRVRD